MARAVMHARCPRGRRLGAARLDAHRLVFHLPSRRWGGHAAGIVPAAESVVWGVLWSLPAGDLDSLDTFEAAYVRTTVDVAGGAGVESAGVRRRAVTYSVKATRRVEPPGLPAAEYLAAMMEGARHAGLPSPYLRFLATHARR